MAPIQARFYEFKLDTAAREVIYRGVADGGAVVEIRQPQDDLDVMLVLVAGVLERSLTAEARKMSAHAVHSVSVEGGSPDGAVVTFFSPPGVSRSFRIDGTMVNQLARDLGRSRFAVIERAPSD